MKNIPEINLALLLEEAKARRVNAKKEQVLLLINEKLEKLEIIKARMERDQETLNDIASDLKSIEQGDWGRLTGSLTRRRKPDTPAYV